MKGYVGVRRGAHGDLWFYKVFLGRDPVTGTKKYVSKTGFSTRADAERYMELYISALKKRCRPDGECAAEEGDDDRTHKGVQGQEGPHLWLQSP